MLCYMFLWKLNQDETEIQFCCIPLFSSHCEIIQIICFPQKEVSAQLVICSWELKNWACEVFHLLLDIRQTHVVVSRL